MGTHTCKVLIGGESTEKINILKDMIIVVNSNEVGESCDDSGNPPEASWI